MSNKWRLRVPLPIVVSAFFFRRTEHLKKKNTHKKHTTHNSGVSSIFFPSKLVFSKLRVIFFDRACYGLLRTASRKIRGSRQEVARSASFEIV